MNKFHIRYVLGGKKYSAIVYRPEGSVYGQMTEEEAWKTEPNVYRVKRMGE